MSVQNGSAKTLLKSVLREDSRASEKQCFDTFYIRLQQNADALKEVAADWFVRNYARLEIIEPQKHSVAVVERQAAERKMVGANQASKERGILHKAKAAIIDCLLDFVLSDGKQLRFATFGDCARDGGWLLAVAKCGRPNEIVGKKLTEIDLRNLRQRNAA